MRQTIVPKRQFPTTMISFKVLNNARVWLIKNYFCHICCIKMQKRIQILLKLNFSDDRL